MPAPLDDPALDFEVLREEPHLVALAAGHPLTERSILRLADLDAALRRTDLPILWTPAGGAAPPIADITQLLWLVESGELAALLPASVAARYERPQLVYRRVVDAPPARLAVAWPRSSRSLATASFVRAAVDAAADISDSTTSSRLA
jgi:DNA-binding transcriptional LysR family regulator